MKNLNIQNIKTDDLTPYAHNARQHDKKQIKQIAHSIKEFGFIVPVLIDANKCIVAGHGRVMAADILKMVHVPCIQVKHLTENQKRAFIIADNKLTENAGWDMHILAMEFEELMTLDLDFDLGITGFDMPEINMIIEGQYEEDKLSPADDLPIEKNIKPVARTGDLWQLGDHFVFCGDALLANSYKTLMSDKQASMILTDPPYNVPIVGNVSGLGKKKHGEFAMASGEMSAPEFTLFLETVFERLKENSTEGSVHYIFMDWRHMQEILQAGQVYQELKNLCVWTKDNAGMGTFYRSQHELCFVFKRDQHKHINNFELGQYGRHRSNVWQYRGANSLAGRKAEGDNPLDLHPTVKPTDMLQDAIKDCSHRHDIILDPFLGSGSTLIAAEQIGRRCYGIEIDPHYVDVIIARFEKLTGKTAFKINATEKKHG